MYYHKAGFAMGEPMATHSRRRFRLVIPPNVHNPNAPQVDPSLWIVHYGPVDNNEPIPAAMLPRDPRTQSMVDTRGYLQRCGQIQRKEFILSDRVNWPQIPWPREPSRAPVYAGNRGVPQAIAYPPHPPAATGPPSKRARTGQAAHGQAPSTMTIPQQDSVYDDEEDISRGDMFDYLTAREISNERYQQNHAWMEEILSSPYRLGQIKFPDLGFGLKGELSSLTEGIFEAHTNDAIAPKQADKASTVRLDPEQADAFHKRIDSHIESTNSEIEKMKAEHAKKMARFKQNSLLSVAERELRTAVDGPGSDAFQLEGRTEESEEGASRWHSKHNKKVEDIVSQVEAHIGRQTKVIHDLRRIQDGGYQEPEPEPVPEPVSVPPQPNVATEAQSAGANASAAMSRQPSHAGSQNSGIMIGDSDIDMGGTAAGLLDQMHTGLSSHSTPANNNFPTPQAPVSAVQSAAGTPAHQSVPSPQPAPQQTETPKQTEAGDVKMDGTESTTTPDQGTGSGDWVVVPKGDAPPDAASGNNNNNNNTPTATATATTSNDPPIPQGTSATAAATATAATAAASSNSSSSASNKQPSAAGTPAAAAGGESSMGSMGGFEGEQNDFSSLGDLDTAGSAMADFANTPGGGLGPEEESLDLNMDMDDSAFGDAFHGVESAQEGGNTPGGDGM